MGNTEFEYNAIKIVEDYIREFYTYKLDEPYSTSVEKMLGANGVYVVWLCKTLQNNKALLSTDIEDGMYYEVTYNGDKKEFYLDVYKKTENILIKTKEVK